MESCKGLLFLAGSTRQGSYNQRLVDEAAGVAERSNVPVTTVYLRDYHLPIFNADSAPIIVPEPVLKLKAEFQRHAAIFIASPEHNGSVSVLVKNMIDWLSCSTGDEAPLAFTAFRGKIFGLISASPSPFGGLRGLAHLRDILTMLQGVVVPGQLALTNAHKAFEGESLADPLAGRLLEDLVGTVMNMSRRLDA